jgi:hypothetical protein
MSQSTEACVRCPETCGLLAPDDELAPVAPGWVGYDPAALDSDRARLAKTAKLRHNGM